MGVLLVFLPARLLEWSGITRPAVAGWAQVLGAVVALAGAALAVGCVLTFALVGRGTPAPFGPPRGLVVSGPYRIVRNPMYIGASLALVGASLFYLSPALLAYAALFALGTHVFVVIRGADARAHLRSEYEAYRERVRRWWPTW